MIRLAVIAALFGTAFAQQPPPVDALDMHVRSTNAIGRLFALARDTAPVSAIKQTVTVSIKPALGQGSTGGCVGFAFTHWLNAKWTGGGPAYNKRSDFALQLYRANRDTDDSTSNDGDDSAGTYPFHAEQVLKSWGYLASVDRQDIALEKNLRSHLLTVGPVALSIAWYTGFDVPDANGGIHLGGTIRGGHEILCYSFAEKTKSLPSRYLLEQSWAGYAPYDKFNQLVWISAADMRRLLNRGGWAAAPVKATARVK